MANQFPNLKIIGEEGQSDLNVPPEWLVTDEDVEFLKNPCPQKYENLTDEQLNSLVLWVDPLDGTAEYTQGFLEHVTVLIGLSMNEEAIGGKLISLKSDSFIATVTAPSFKCLLKIGSAVSDRLE